MNSPSVGLGVSSIIFAIVALGHLLRAFLQFEISYGPYRVGTWSSLLVALIAGALSISMGWLASRGQRNEASEKTIPVRPPPAPPQPPY